MHVSALQRNSWALRSYYDSASGNLTGKTGLTLSYDNVNHKHAVSAAGSNAYGYDANGNMTTRSAQQTLAYDAEGRLLAATGAAYSAAFVYDGDGRRVKSIVNGKTTLYIGDIYETDLTTITKYYYAGSQRVAACTAVRCKCAQEWRAIVFISGSTRFDQPGDERRRNKNRQTALERSPP